MVTTKCVSCENGDNKMCLLVDLRLSVWLNAIIFYSTVYSTVDVGTGRQMWQHFALTFDYISTKKKPHMTVFSAILLHITFSYFRIVGASSGSDRAKNKYKQYLFNLIEIFQAPPWSQALITSLYHQLYRHSLWWMLIFLHYFTFIR